MHKLKNTFSVFFAYLLLFAFCAIQVTEVLHHHVDDHHVSGALILKNHSADLSLADAVQKCKICKDLSSRQSAVQPLEIASYNFALSVPAVQLTAVYKQTLFEAAVNTWTNKGPPIS